MDSINNKCKILDIKERLHDIQMEILEIVSNYADYEALCNQMYEFPEDFSEENIKDDIIRKLVVANHKIWQANCDIQSTYKLWDEKVTEQFRQKREQYHCDLDMLEHKDAVLVIEELVDTEINIEPKNVKGFMALKLLGIEKSQWENYIYQSIEGILYSYGDEEDIDDYLLMLSYVRELEELLTEVKKQLISGGEET